MDESCDGLVLSCGTEPLREFPLRAGMTIGRAPSCDVVVHDPDLADVAFTVRDGALVDPSGQGAELVVGEAIAVGEHHSLTRVATVVAPITVGTTEPLGVHREHVSLSIVIGVGPSARRIPIDRELTVGSSPRCDVVLDDRAVSGVHCRLERRLGTLRVRDLGSRNGTWVRGCAVLQTELGAGAVVRVGRTDLQIVPRGRRGDARAEGMVAVSASMLAVLGEVERYARLTWPLLITGESGVGKEGVARGLHARGSRAGGPFVAINAGGIASGIVESELFGHRKGAFTGAASDRRGAFERADGGTLFLDEIGELPMALQARLLRVLETWSVRRVGGDQPRPVDVRLVCATHRDLRAMIENGTFREDLYYRIHRLSIDVPPLRKRIDDIRPLCEHFLRAIAPEVGARKLSQGAMALLIGHDWPGNVRELRNVVCIAAAASPHAQIAADDVERALERVAGPRPKRVSRSMSVTKVVEQYGGNLSAAARALGIARTTLRDRLRRERAA